LVVLQKLVIEVPAAVPVSCMRARESPPARIAAFTSFTSWFDTVMIEGFP
jgi:hypothetical protein